MEHSEEKGSHTTVIRRFAESDIPVMVVRFAEHHWSKPAEIFEEYLREQKAGDRVVWIASVDNEFAGYITLAWRSQYQPFRDRQIPEVMDLNVLPPFRRGGCWPEIACDSRIRGCYQRRCCWHRSGPVWR